jgi:hypothetical protein
MNTQCREVLQSSRKPPSNFNIFESNRALQLEMANGWMLAEEANDCVPFFVIRWVVMDVECFQRWQVYWTFKCPVATIKGSDEEAVSIKAIPEMIEVYCAEDGPPEKGRKGVIPSLADSNEACEIMASQEGGQHKSELGQVKWIDDHHCL